MEISSLSTEDIISLYPAILKELKQRKVITTNNFIGELGEYLAINAYNKNSSLNNLQKADVSTQNIDAISNKGERYSIKSVSGSATGVFHSLSGEKDFEFLIIVQFGKDYELLRIIQLTWNQFIKIRRMKKPENKYNVPITQKNLENGKIIYQSELIN